MAYAGRVLSGWFVAFVLAIALVVSLPEKPARAISHEVTSPISVSFAASEEVGDGLSNHTLACHIHFEHHQLVRSENAFVMPALDSVRASYLTCVNPLATLDPYPLQRPHRA